MATVTCIAMRRHECDASLARDPLAVINSASRSVIFAAAGSEDSRSHDRQKDQENICFLTLFSLLYSSLVNLQILSSWRRDLSHFSNKVEGEIARFKVTFINQNLSMHFNFIFCFSSTRIFYDLFHFLKKFDLVHLRRDLNGKAINLSRQSIN